MFVLGLTGGIGSGKTAASDYFRSLGVEVVDADIAARTVVEPGGPALAAIEERFGPSILQADGSLNRAALRAIVFADPAERVWLEQLTHPLIGEEITAQLASAGSKYAVLVSPLLQGAQRELCDEVLVIDAPEELQVERTVARDGDPEEQVRNIMAAQQSREDRLASADHVILNDGGLDKLYSELDAVHSHVLAHITTSPLRTAVLLAILLVLYDTLL